MLMLGRIWSSIVKTRLSKLLSIEQCRRSATAFIQQSYALPVHAVCESKCVRKGQVLVSTKLYCPELWGVGGKQTVLDEAEEPTALSRDNAEKIKKEERR